MDAKLAKKLINEALSALLSEIDDDDRDSSNYIPEALGLKTTEEAKEAIETFKRDFVIVPEDDPGLRMVETEIKL